MPNTLVHIGIQTGVSKAVWPEVDFKWVAVGCVLPDVPWISQRIFLLLGSNVDQYDLLNYFTVQAALFSCLLLAGALAFLVRDGARIFLLLAANSLLHLFLDALQIKWANSVHLFAPFSWNRVSFHLVWPEHGVIFALTIVGLLTMLYCGFRDWRRPVRLLVTRGRVGLSVLLLLLYCTAPLMFMDDLVRLDSHFSTTLRNISERPGKYLELDRVRYRHSDNTVLLPNDERVTLQGHLPDRDSVVSIKGSFRDTGTIHVSGLHVHSLMRDLSSIIALAAIFLLWLAAVGTRRVSVSVDW